MSVYNAYIKCRSVIVKTKNKKHQISNNNKLKYSKIIFGFVFARTTRNKIAQNKIRLSLKRILSEYIPGLHRSMNLDLTNSIGR